MKYLNVDFAGVRTERETYSVRQLETGHRTRSNHNKTPQNTLCSNLHIGRCVKIVLKSERGTVHRRNPVRTRSLHHDVIEKAPVIYRDKQRVSRALRRTNPRPREALLAAAR
jgi:hypothetical protein